MSTPDRAHHHNNPSPSLAVGAWCNGRPDDPGCGRFVPLDSFTPERAAYFDPYLVDRRTLDAANERLRGAALALVNAAPSERWATMERLREALWASTRTLGRDRPHRRETLTMPDSDGSAALGSIPAEVMAWYEANASEAVKIMLPGTKGYMLANEAVPNLAAEVRKLRSIIGRVCSHPNKPRHDGTCVYCGAVMDAGAGLSSTQGDGIDRQKGT